MAKRVGPQYEAAEYEDLSGEKGSSLDNVITDDRRGYRTFRRRHNGTLNESTNVSVKTGGSRVGVPNYASRIDGNRRQGTQCLPRFGPSLWR